MSRAKSTETIFKDKYQKMTRAPAWFWAHAWQRKEREASADIRMRRIRTYTSNGEFLDSLEKR
jgi:hypothetical protein